MVFKPGGYCFIFREEKQNAPQNRYIQLVERDVGIQSPHLRTSGNSLRNTNLVQLLELGTENSLEDGHLITKGI